MPHEWCREHVVRHISVIIPTYALRHIQTAARTRKGYVELARVLGEHLRVGATVEVGHASVYGVEHYHVVELQTLRLMDCRDEDALAHAVAAAEVSLLQRTYLHSMVGELLVERRLGRGVNHVGGKIRRHVMQSADGLHTVVGEKCAVESLQLSHQRHPILHSLRIRHILILSILCLMGCTCLKRTIKTRSNHISYVHTVYRRAIQFAVIAAQQFGTLAHTGVTEERKLLLHPRLRQAVAMRDDAARGVHVVVGKVRVGAFQAERREKILQFVLAQFGMQQTHKAQ